MPKGKKLTQAETEALRSDYSDAAAATLLDDAFGRWESRTDSFRVPHLDRNDHIIIGGRTASELLMEKFNAEFDTMRSPDGEKWKSNQRAYAYGFFLANDGKQYINQRITNALSNGEKVEVFVPDKTTGRIKDQPMSLTARGYEPTGPLAKPKQLNGWQKFWSKLGFYKKEKAAVVNYENEMAARQKVQFCNKAARAGLCTNYAMAPAYLEEMDKYHPEIREDMAKNFPKANGDPAKMGEANGFKTNRSSFQSTVMTLLATKRDENGKLLYTNEQMFDMADPKMQKARADATKEVYERYKAGDSGWLADLQYNAAGILRDRIDKQAEKLNFTKPNLTEQKGYREFAMLSDTGFDQNQDVNVNDKLIDQKYGKGAYQETTAILGYCTSQYRDIMQSLNSQKYLLNGIQGQGRDKTTDEIANVVKGQAIQQHIAKGMKESGRKFSDVANFDMVMQINTMQHQAEYDDDKVAAYEKKEGDIPNLMKQTVALADEQIRDPKKIGAQIQSGVFERRLKLQEFSLDMAAEEPVKFDVRDAATAEREMTRQTVGASAL